MNLMVAVRVTAGQRVSRTDGAGGVGRLSIALAIVLALVGPLRADRFVCAGQLAIPSVPGELPSPLPGAAKLAASPTRGTRNVLILFARFADDEDGSLPLWAGLLLDPVVPGSVSHFWDAMSLGQLRVRGAVGPRCYVSTGPAADYLATVPDQTGGFGRFALEIIKQADRDIDMAGFDNDGPDGLPGSGDDDGVVDAVIIIIARAPSGLFVADATGISSLGQRSPYVTADTGQGGTAVVVSSYQGGVLQGRTFTEAAGALCHEYGHLLGLDDLYNAPAAVRADGLPEDDSAGAGAWCLMGWGALGWHGNDGPSALSAWSRMQLGWARVTEPTQQQTTISLPEVGQAGDLLRVGLNRRESFLLEYRRRTSSYYDRGIPAEGVLIWHVGWDSASSDQPSGVTVDLECADGRWRDAGFPLGQRPDPLGGGDNLDFWSHDDVYTASHAGNLGDATDAFDGARYTAFTPATNPSSSSQSQGPAVWLTDLRLDGLVARAQLRTGAPEVRLTSLRGRDAVVAAGVVTRITFTVANRGGLPAAGLWARLRTDDPRLEVLDSTVVVADLAVGQETSGQGACPTGFPRLRFRPGLAASAAAQVTLELLDASGAVLDVAAATLAAVPSRRLSGTVRTAAGQSLAGVRVTYQPTGAAANTCVDTDTRSDAQGAYELFELPGRGTLAAVVDADLPWADQASSFTVQADTVVDWTLPRCYYLSGVVRDRTGVAAPQIIVTALQTRVPVQAVAVTAADGSYRLKLLPGPYTVITRPGDSGPLPYGQQTIGRVDLAADAGLDIVLEPGLELAVKVLDPSGQPVKGVPLALSVVGDPMLGYENLGFHQQPDGVSARVAPGAFIVTAGAVPEPYLVPAARVIQVVSDTLVLLRLQRGVTVTANLRMPSGAALPTGLTGGLDWVPVGLAARAQAPLVNAQATVTVAPGAYQVSWYLTSVAGPVGPPSQNVGLLAVGQDTTVVLAVRPGALVKGRVTLADGRTAVTEGTLVLSARADGASTSTGVGSDGGYAVAVLPGQYQMAWLSAAATGSLGAVTITGDTVLDWRLPSVEAVEVRLRDAAGHPATGWRMTAAAVDGAVASASGVGPEGDVALRLFPGDYGLRATDSVRRPNHAYGLGALALPGRAAGVWSPPGGAQLEVEVVDADGLPTYANVLVLGRLDQPQDWVWGSVVAEALTWNDGRTVFDLDPGSYSVAAYQEWIFGGWSGVRSPVGRVLVGQSTGTRAPIRLVLPAPNPVARLCGRVTDQHGRLVTALLQFYDATQGLTARVWQRGAPYVVDLPPGNYHVVIASAVLDQPPRLVRAGPVAVTIDRTWDLVLTPTGTAIAQPAGALPGQPALSQNYPNPFNTQTLIRYDVAASGDLRLVVYDLAGQVVRRLVDGQVAAGSYVVPWDACDAKGRAVASGVYLYRLTTGGRNLVRRLAVVR